MKKQEQLLDEKNTKKKKLENEINQINESYLKNQETLLKEENSLREQLDIQVTKIKEQLEKSLSQANNEIIIKERINKGIKQLQKNHNILKDLTYISKMNKIQKSMKNLIKQKIINARIHFDEKKSGIIFHEYYFNGLTKPYNIIINDSMLGYANVSWKNDLHLDDDKIQYIIEIRKGNEEFKEVYRGRNITYKLDNLIVNINYDLRICSICNDIRGQWSKVHTFSIKFPEKKKIKEIKEKKNIQIC